MAAAAIAISAVQNPLTWTSSTVDASLICGHSYFRKQNCTRPPEYKNMAMNVDEIVGTVDKVCGALSISIQEHSDRAIYGMLNKFNPTDRNILRLDNAISEFMQSEFNYAILTCNGQKILICNFSWRNINLL